MRGTKRSSQFRLVLGMFTDLLSFRRQGRAITVSSMLLLYLCIHVCPQIGHISAQNMLNYNCTNTIGIYTQDSLFHSNLNNIISETALNIAQFGFNGSTGKGVDTVYAIALCWEYVDTESCRRCIKDDAGNNLTKVCPNQKEAIGWYDDCMFRYSSNYNIIGNMSLTHFYKKQNSTLATNISGFSETLNYVGCSLLESLRISFKSNPSYKYIAGNSSTSPGGDDIYGYMQCTNDISYDDCISCLNYTKNALLKCCNNVVGASYQTPSCVFRFEIYPFLDGPSDQTPPPLSSSSTKNIKSKSLVIATVIVALVTLASLLLALCFLVFSWIETITSNRRRRMKNANAGHKQKEQDELKILRDTQTRKYNFSLIRAATEDFSIANKLGRGGFGEVYKGVLPDGKEIAVKRLSTTSGQGEKEFMNEVKSLAKLQHKCLVKLLGFCLELTERLVIYEFMANGSLDKVLFDPINRTRLDWEHRYKIIKSVARGVMYLHEDSHMTIIHRDLKAGNILLDEKMNAKISDFGMARLFVVDEGEVRTRRIVGTFGYMAPEYAMHGLFSVKSDVYSYGVLLLEIICGKKTYSALTEDNLEDLPVYAYKTWKEDKALELIDPVLTVDSYSMQNMMRCIHTALLCVQENAGDRPTMATVIMMLQSSTLTLPTPSGPGFFIRNTETVAPNIENSSYHMLLNDGETDSYQCPR